MFDLNGGSAWAGGLSGFLNASRVNANGALQLAVCGGNRTRLGNSTVNVDDVSISATL